MAAAGCETTARVESKPPGILAATSESSRTPSPRASALPHKRPILTPGPDQVHLVRGWWRLVRTQQEHLRNSLHDGVGFLELANAGDFAANVFNEIPVPIYAIPLMAIGGVLALILPYFAVVDAQRSWQNFRALRAERHRLRSQKDTADESDARICLDMNFKELGVEVVDRLIMDTLLGGGAVVVGIGTLMAIDGANKSVFVVSNLLSGYVGNGLAAMFGLINSMWAVFVWNRAQRHNHTVKRELADGPVRVLQQCRVDAVKRHAVGYGLASLVAGAASMLTATTWWGYVILAPCCVGSIWSNLYFKRNVGYDRPMFRTIPEIDEQELIAELAMAHYRTEAMRTMTLVEFLQQTGHNLDTLPAAVDFLVTYNLFDDFALALTQTRALLPALDGSGSCRGEGLVIRAQTVLEAPATHWPRLLELACACIEQHGPRQLVYRQRFLLELLGNSLRYKTMRPSAGSSSVRRPSPSPSRPCPPAPSAAAPSTASKEAATIEE